MFGFRIVPVNRTTHFITNDGRVYASRPRSYPDPWAGQIGRARAKVHLHYMEANFAANAHKWGCGMQDAAGEAIDAFRELAGVAS